MMINNHFSKILFFFALFSLNACSSESPKTLHITVAHMVKGKQLVFEDKVYSTTAGHGFKVFRLKYYLSDFKLKNEDGAVFKIDKVHLFDALESETLQCSLGAIAPGNYTELSFVFGLNKEKNKEGSLENTMDNNTMEWPVIGEKGYHYMKFEGKYDSLQTNTWKNFNLHTGPTGNNQNFVTFNLKLPKGKAVEANWAIDLEMDLDRLLHHPKDYSFSEFGQGIMGNQEAQEILKGNAGDVFQIIEAN